jgi:hypothetical protein
MCIPRTALSFFGVQGARGDKAKVLGSSSCVFHTSDRHYHDVHSSHGALFLRRTRRKAEGVQSFYSNTKASDHVHCSKLRTCDTRDVH